MGVCKGDIVQALAQAVTAHLDVAVHGVQGEGAETGRSHNQGEGTRTQQH